MKTMLGGPILDESDPQLESETPSAMTAATRANLRHLILSLRPIADPIPLIEGSIRR
jgi:hypothetical protein